MNLIIIRQLLTFLENQGAVVWTMRQTLGILSFTGIMSGFSLIVLRYVGYFLTGNAFYLEFGYNSLNILVMCIIMGLRQRFPEREFDT